MQQGGWQQQLQLQRLQQRPAGAVVADHWEPSPDRGTQRGAKRGRWEDGGGSSRGPPQLAALRARGDRGYQHPPPPAAPSPPGFHGQGQFWEGQGREGAEWGRAAGGRGQQYGGHAAGSGQGYGWGR
jgi:hypothetical protein